MKIPFVVHGPDFRLFRPFNDGGITLPRIIHHVLKAVIGFAIACIVVLAISPFHSPVALRWYVGFGSAAAGILTLHIVEWRLKIYQFDPWDWCNELACATAFFPVVAWYIGQLSTARTVGYIILVAYWLTVWFATP